MLNTNTNRQTVKSRPDQSGLSAKHITMIFAMLIALATSFATAQTAPLKQWDLRFGGSQDEILRSLQQTADGGYILGGESSSGISGDKTQASQGGNDYWMVKTDANGVKQWDARFGGSSDEDLESIQQTADEGYILGGWSASGISGDRAQASQGGKDYWMVKTDANGVKQWDKRFGGSADDWFGSLQQTADGGYILGGWSYSGISGDKTQASQGGADYWIVKTDASGVKQWDARFGGSGDEPFKNVQQTPDGGYILAGFSFSGISGDKTQASWGERDYWLVKTDANGVKQWDARFGGSSIDATGSLEQTADGGYILGGWSFSGISGDKTQASQGAQDYWIVKTDANGVKQWDARFGGSSTEVITLQSVWQTADGGYIVGGYSDSGISGDITQAGRGGPDYWIVKTDANGIKQWDARFGGSGNDQILTLQQTADGGYILGGLSTSGIGGDKTQASRGGYDFWIVKVASECNGGSTVYADADSDGYGDIANSLFVADCIAPSGYVYDSTDCNDANAAIHPGACDANNGDGVDDNCDGIIDDGFGATTYYTDADGDGYGAGTATSLCSNPGAGYSTDNTDCDDANASVNPAATEVTNGIDDDCNGIIDDNICPLPLSLSVSKITGTSAKLKWDAVAGAEGYTVRYKIANTDGWKYGTTHGNSKPLSGLSPNTVYKWQVQTFCHVDPPYIMSGWSSKLEFTTGSLRMGDESLQQVSFQIYPNPAEDHATIQFSVGVPSDTLPQTSHVYIKVYDVSGKEIATLLDEDIEQGDHLLLFSTNHFSKGVYLIKMIADFGIVHGTPYGENQKLIVQ